MPLRTLSSTPSTFNFGLYSLSLCLFGFSLPFASFLASLTETSIVTYGNKVVYSLLDTLCNTVGLFIEIYLVSWKKNEEKNQKEARLLRTEN
jgi:hypothetical protein